MLVKRFFILLSLVVSTSFGQNTQWKIDSEASSIRYKGDHLLHAWEGVNDKVYGLAVPSSKEEGIEKLAILVYIRDFDSKNSGRDAHSLEVLEALQFPEVKFYSESIEIEGQKLRMKGSFDFHGAKIDKSILADLEQQDSQWKISGSFELTPTDFNIDLPSFLSIKMKDLLEFEYRIVLKK